VLLAVKNILLNADESKGHQKIPADRIAFEGEDVTLDSDMVFSPFQDAEKCYWLRICNALLAAGGFYALYTDNEGRFKTKPIESPADDPWAVTYLGNGDSGDDGEELITEEIQWEYSREFYNKVTVYSSEATGGVPVVATASLVVTSPGDSGTNVYVVDPDNPYAYGPGTAVGKRYFTRPPESFEKIKDFSQAKKLAKALLRRSASRQEKLTVVTVPDPRRGPREDYWIRARQADGGVIYHGFKENEEAKKRGLDDRFRVVGWTLPLDGQSGMTHEVTRLLKG